MNHSTIFSNTIINTNCIPIVTKEDAEVVYFYHLVFEKLNQLSKIKDFSNNSVVIDNLKNIINYDIKTKTAEITLYDDKAYVIDEGQVKKSMTTHSNKFIDIIPQHIDDIATNKIYDIFDVKNCGFVNLTDEVTFIEYDNKFYYVMTEYRQLRDFIFPDSDYITNIIRQTIHSNFLRHYESYREGRWDLSEDCPKIQYHYITINNCDSRVIDGFEQATVFSEIDSNAIMKIHEYDTVNKTMKFISDISFTEPKHFAEMRLEFKNKHIENKKKEERGWFAKLF